ncbi:MAG: hypothetical protein WBF88_06980 [Pusillimonas sp.]
MKVWIILLSLLAAATTWWWHTRKTPDGRQNNMRQRLKAVARSVVAGIAAYFVLMSIALVYLMATSN